MALPKFMAFFKLQTRKLLREHLATISIVPFLLCSVVFAWRPGPLRTYWLFQFAYLTIVASALTAGLYHDDIRSGNLELVLSRRISATKVVLAKFASAYVIGLFVPLLALATALVAFGQPLGGALQFALVSVTSLGFWMAAFCVLSGLLEPRFNWMVVLGVYLIIPRWLTVDASYSLAGVTASATGYAAFTVLYRWQILDSASLRSSLAATVCLLAAQVVMVNRRWMRA